MQRPSMSESHCDVVSDVVAPSVKGDDVEVTHFAPRATPWYRRKALLAALVAGLAVIALVIGLAVGLTSGGHSSSGSKTASTTASSAPVSAESFVEGSSCLPNEYTLSTSGTECWYDSSSTDCASCAEGSCQCSEGMGSVCVPCGQSEMCPSTDPCGNGGGCTLNEYTLVSSGHECYYDSDSTDCALCAAGSCQCGPGKGSVCVPCGSDMCESEVPCNSTTTSHTTTSGGGNPTINNYVIQITGDKETMVNNAAASDVDLVVTYCAIGDEWLDSATVAKIKSNDKLAICYVSVGEAADWYWYNLSEQPTHYQDNKYYTKFWESEWQSTMNQWVATAMDNGWDGVWIDTVETYKTAVSEGWAGMTLEESANTMIDVIESMYDTAVDHYKGSHGKPYLAPNFGIDITQYCDSAHASTYRNIISAVGAESTFYPNEQTGNEADLQDYYVGQGITVLSIEYNVPDKSSYQALCDKYNYVSYATIPALNEWSPPGRY
eukprot:Clim_evm7s29 gene=Clim_evmTU7s29